MRYQLTIDSVARDLGDNTGEYVYTLAINRSEHSGTPDPSLAWSLTAIDAFGQTSPAAASTAINAAPATAPTSVSLVGGFTAITASVNPGTLPPDFVSYRYRIIQTSPVVADVIIDQTTTVLVRSVDATATYQVAVAIRDAFDQIGPEATSGTAFVESISIGSLRTEAAYFDSIGTNVDTLKTALADDNRISGGISYTANAAWRWIQMYRPFLERTRRATAALNVTGGTTSVYLRTSTDGGATWRYWSGPLVNGRTLTSVATEAAAQTAAVSWSTVTSQRLEFPVTAEARSAELWFRNTTNTTRVDEYYWRRLAEVDDLYVEVLSGITANLGTITAGTIIGTTIQTATSGARVEMTPTGLRTYDSAGTIQVEATTANDGALTAGAGTVRLDSTGMRILTTNTPQDKQDISWFDPTLATKYGRIGLDTTSGMVMESLSSLGPNRYALVRAGDAVMSTDHRSGTATASLGVGTGSVSLRSTGFLFITVASTVITGNLSASGTLSAGATTITGATTISSTLSAGALTSTLTSGDVRTVERGTAIDLNIRGNSGKASALSFIENGVADRWVIYTKPGDAHLYFDVGGFTSSATGFQMTNDGGLLAKANSAIGALGTPPVSTRLLVRGAGTSSATNALSVQNSGLTTLMSMRDDGLPTVNQAWTISSDRRLKRQIVPITSALDILALLNPVRYGLRADTGNTLHAGLIADEVQRVIPHLIDTGDDGYQSLRYNDLIAYLIRAVQELHERIV